MLVTASAGIALVAGAGVVVVQRPRQETQAIATQTEHIMRAHLSETGRHQVSRGAVGVFSVVATAGGGAGGFVHKIGFRKCLKG